MPFNSGNVPSYVELYASGELYRRANLLMERLNDCDLCPRECHVNRTVKGKGFCGSGKKVTIAAYCDHHGEEPAISGSRGSGTIFFTNCNLRCVYCQNFQISQASRESDYATLDPENLAEIMLTIQNDLNCHNVNLVSPSHFIPQIVKALDIAIGQGFLLPLVYNSNAYDSVSILKTLEGIIDIYLPDLKYASDACASEFSGASNYVNFARLAVKEMYRQVGNLICDQERIAIRGLIVRHLVLPSRLSGTQDCLKWLVSEISENITLSVMSQYHPRHQAHRHPKLSRKITRGEYREVTEMISELGIERGWVQEKDSANNYLPDFNSKDNPFQS